LLFSNHVSWRNIVKKYVVFSFERKSQKDERLKEEARSTRQAEKLKTKYEQEAKMEKSQECEKTFQEFLRKKGTSKRPPPSPTLKQR
jgi:Mrp family chromosome partitioning ATPase